jgi:hypothetical protein
VFIPKDFTQKILDACESIVDIITNSEYKQLTKNAIPAHLQVPGENEHSHFIAFDFGVCINEEGEYEPQLIEMQGFPLCLLMKYCLMMFAEKIADSGWI